MKILFFDEKKYFEKCNMKKQKKTAYRNSWTLDAGVEHWTLDARLWTLDAGL